jgi:hypothetical protein
VSNVLSVRSGWGRALPNADADAGGVWHWMVPWDAETPREIGTNVDRPHHTFMTHIYDDCGRLVAYYTHQTMDGAVRSAAMDVVAGAQHIEGYFERTHHHRLDEFAHVIERVVERALLVPGSNPRWHITFDAWWAHVDEMEIAQ